MERNQNTQAAAIALIGVVGSGYYIWTALSERKKRKKIAAWRDENLACIANSAQRLDQIVSNPNFTIQEFADAMHEEQTFLSIVRNQPKY